MFQKLFGAPNFQTLLAILVPLGSHFRFCSQYSLASGVRVPRLRYASIDNNEYALFGYFEKEYLTN